MAMDGRRCPRSCTGGGRVDTRTRREPTKAHNWGLKVNEYLLWLDAAAGRLARLGRRSGHNGPQSTGLELIKQTASIHSVF
jgi:hypothetical protein